jgi:hypothetical protein
MDSFIGEPLVVSALMLCPQMGKVMVIRSRLGDTLLLMGRSRLGDTLLLMGRTRLGDTLLLMGRTRLGDTLLLMGRGRVSEIRCYLWRVVASRRYAATYGAVASRRYAATYWLIASLRDYDESNETVRATSVRLAPPLCSTFDFLCSTFLYLPRWDDRGRSVRINTPAETSLSVSTDRLNPTADRVPAPNTFRR